MNPRHRSLYPPMDSVVPTFPSPKKNPRPIVLRQEYALPSIHQFEPVRGGSFGKPLYDQGETTIPPVKPPARLLSPRLTINDKLSPHFRPHPPISAAISSRTDQDLYRYSQGMKQRMAIRPLFEQRREEEADIARRILVSREADPGWSQQGRREADDPDNPLSREKDGDDLTYPMYVTASAMPRRATTPVTASELGELQQLSPRGANCRSIEISRSKPQLPQVAKEWGRDVATVSGPAIESGSEHTETNLFTEKDLVSVDRGGSSTPSPPRSAGPDRSHLEGSGSMTDGEFANNCEEPNLGNQNSSSNDHALPLEVSETLVRLTDGSLVAALDSKILHAPFLEKRGSKLNWLAQKSSSAQTAPTVIGKPSAPRDAHSNVCYKVLWRDNANFATSDGETETFDFRVLLGSNGKSHIGITKFGATDEDEEKLAISEADLLASAKSRPDLPPMSPKWAKWLFSRLGRDIQGRWFLRIQDILAMEETCVFSEDVRIAPLQTDEEGQGELVVRVSIYVLNPDDQDSEDLLVHALNLTATPPSLTELVLTSRELKTMGEALRYITASIEPSDATRDELRLTLRDKEFLRRAVAESKMLRLALRSGLNIAKATESVWDLPFRTGSRAASATIPGPSTESTESSMNAIPPPLSVMLTEYETQGLLYATPEIQLLVRSNEQLAEVVFLSQAYCEDAIAAALRWLQRNQAVEAYIETYINDITEDSKMSESVRKRVEAMKQAKLKDLALRAIVEDMIVDFIAVECRLELHYAKFSGGYDDFYASKVQSAFRMSYQRRDYVSKRNVRNRAVRLIQALQRGIMARRRYCEMRIEREKYLFFGFRSSLHHATATIEDPRHRAMEVAQETERRRQTFLMQVLHGYVVEHGLTTPFRISPELAQNIFNEYSVVVGCSPTLGDTVAAVLVSSRHSQPLPKKSTSRTPPPRFLGSREIHAALVTALRMQYDDTYGLSSGVRLVEAREQSPSRVQMMVNAKADNRASSVSDENAPPRWLLKASPPFQRANRNRIAALRLTQKSAGQRAAHLVTSDYRNLLCNAFGEFEKCRSIWEANIRTRKQQAHLYDTFSLEELVHFALDRLTMAVKDWGLDPESLFEALNLCLVHRLGKQAISLAEEAFGRYAQGVNDMHGKRSVLSLREEISQELEKFESLLALRCLNIASDAIVTVPASEILHALLNGKVDDEYTRHALTSVLPIAGINEKMQLAEMMVRGYANAMYGEAFNSICWSCLDTAESVTVEAAQFLERITRHSTSDYECLYSPAHPENPTRAAECSLAKTSIAERALYLLTGSQALRFLHFLAKVAHFNKPLQRRVLEQLEPHARDHELYRLASVVCSIDSFDVVSRLFDNNFHAASVHGATRFWVQYGTLYGEEQAEAARASCRPSDGSCSEADPHHSHSQLPVPQQPALRDA